VAGDQSLVSLAVNEGTARRSFEHLVLQPLSAAGPRNTLVGTECLSRRGHRSAWSPILTLLAGRAASAYTTAVHTPREDDGSTRSTRHT